MSILPHTVKQSKVTFTSQSSSSSSSSHYGFSHSHSTSQPSQITPTDSATSISTAADPSELSQQEKNLQEADPNVNGGSNSKLKFHGGRRGNLTNGNHLLNFHYDPITRSSPSRPPRTHHKINLNLKIKPYNKDLFLQANYKFVVFDSGEYSPDSMDPDQMLRWDDIICLRFSTPCSVQCPICLETPLCPQITSCGHIFCFPCILQYLLMGKEDEKGECWKRCPLCFVLISPKDLYTVFIEYVREHFVGDEIELLLLTRQKDSNSLLPKSKKPEESYDPFSKFTFTSDVELSVRRATSELDGWLAKADSGLVDDIEKLPYVCAALEHLEKRSKYWNEHRACDSSSNRPLKEPDRSAHSNSEVSDFSIQNLSLELGDGNESDVQQPCSAEAVESLESQECVLSSSYDEIRGLHGNSKGSIDVKEKEFYNFYQAADGQHIILHPLNMKCLLHHFGSRDLLPDRICGKILQLETVTQSEAIRRRFRFLSHFSLTTTFQLCEIDLSESLPPDALLPFMDEIKKREKQRKQAARKEQKEKIKAEAAMAIPVPTFSSVHHSFHDEFPVFSMDDFEALGSSSAQSSSPPVVGERKLFSSVTKLGFAAGHDSPSLKIEENNTEKGDSSGPINNAGSSIPSFAAKVISRAKAVESLETPKVNDSGKKGKKPTRVLLSTAGGRRY